MSLHQQPDEERHELYIVLYNARDDNRCLSPHELWDIQVGNRFYAASR